MPFRRGLFHSHTFEFWCFNLYKCLSNNLQAALNVFSKKKWFKKHVNVQNTNIASFNSLKSIHLFVFMKRIKCQTPWSRKRIQELKRIIILQQHYILTNEMIPSQFLMLILKI
ncbi:unnamed protein product [Paramecium pentaurelia]|uniref:Uncharacterized protein n=1 Tax=Paramecium pentaurelia TaxID=43138 RepID=A0A8S1RZJ1_9CILI|nr:unnamed protein product [Paramecium pentaurelia]